MDKYIDKYVNADDGVININTIRDISCNELYCKIIYTHDLYCVLTSICSKTEHPNSYSRLTNGSISEYMERTRK